MPGEINIGASLARGDAAVRGIRDHMMGEVMHMREHGRRHIENAKEFRKSVLDAVDTMAEAHDSRVTHHSAAIEHLERAAKLRKEQDEKVRSATHDQGYSL